MNSHLQAMRLLVDALESRNTAQGRAPLGSASAAPEPAGVMRGPARTPAMMVPKSSKGLPAIRHRGRGRYVPACVRTCGAERDGARCTYGDDRGARCEEPRYLELHHRQRSPRMAPHTAANLTLHAVLTRPRR